MSMTRNMAEEFEELVAPYEKRVYFTCLHMMGNETDAQDCAQETLLLAFRAFGRFRREAQIATWLYRIAKNVCVDALRKRRQDTSLDQLQENGVDIASDAPSPYVCLAQKDRRKLLEQGIQRLQDEHRMVLILRDINGLSYKEVAAVLMIPSGTVKSRVNRAHEKLFGILANNMELFKDLNV